MVELLEQLKQVEIAICSAPQYQELERVAPLQVISRVGAPDLNHPTEYYEIVIVPGDPLPLVDVDDPRYHPSHLMETVAGEVTSGFRKFAKENIGPGIEVNWQGKSGSERRHGWITVEGPVSAFQNYLMRSVQQPHLAA